VKRLKTTLRDLRALFLTRITVQTIAERLFTVPAGQQSVDAQARLNERDFDTAGVQSGSAVIGYVRAADLNRGLVRNHLKQFTSGDTLGAGQSLLLVLGNLTERSWVFISNGQSVDGIVTRGDLQKAPVRMYLFALISVLEMQLLRIIRVRYPNDDWKRFLGPKRLEKAKVIFQARRHANAAIDLLDCIPLADKNTIVVKANDLRIGLGFIDPVEARKFFERLEDLRNDIAHSNEIPSHRWKSIGGLAERSERVLERCEKFAITKMPSAVVSM
jgi:hypothetical protein